MSDKVNSLYDLIVASHMITMQEIRELQEQCFDPEEERTRLFVEMMNQEDLQKSSLEALRRVLSRRGTPDKG